MPLNTRGYDDFNTSLLCSNRRLFARTRLRTRLGYAVIYCLDSEITHGAVASHGAFIENKKRDGRIYSTMSPIEPRLNAAEREGGREGGGAITFYYRIARTIIINNHYRAGRAKLCSPGASAWRIRTNDRGCAEFTRRSR